jgi:hypothetical protein
MCGDDVEGAPRLDSGRTQASHRSGVGKGSFSMHFLLCGIPKLNGCKRGCATFGQYFRRTLVFAPIIYFAVVSSLALVCFSFADSFDKNRVVGSL